MRVQETAHDFSVPRVIDSYCLICYTQMRGWASIFSSLTVTSAGRASPAAISTALMPATGQAAWLQ